MPAVEDRGTPEQEREIYYGRFERENNWATGAAIVMLMMALGVIAFTVTSRENEQERLREEIHELRMQQTQPRPGPMP